MNITLLGYGNMGKEIERIAHAKGAHAVSIALQNAGTKIDMGLIGAADVVIDFTSPEIVLQNIRTIASAGKNMVVGTTGWHEHVNEVKGLVEKSGTGLVYGQNFSIGANIFFQLVANATKLTSAFGAYDVCGLEIHHAGKKDSPSGTALRTAKEILENSTTKKVLQTEKLDRQIKPEELHFASVRGGKNPGFHEVVFDSAADAITISHAAHGREGFAEGAILAAEFINGKKGVYTFDDVVRTKKPGH
ncbi:MAG: 4-hydroxy-tetrahydrodipicolinate reductase [bacterium]|nr:4-hydroxy-tetrahydrodipicolinate reductase [bacterium]